MQTPAGVLLVDKPAGVTSHGVVGIVRRLLTTYYQLQTKPKVGHTGTLDPFATGLLIVALGAATKNIKYTHAWPKEYEATVTLGATSTTDDPEGEITRIADKATPNETITDVLSSFLGEQQQIPPIFSAKKIKGERAYKKARQGKAFSMPPHIIVVHELELIEYNYPELKIRVNCSTGTYIRSLARDIGQKLRTGAYCSSLRRTAIGPHSVKSATPLSELIQKSFPHFDSCLPSSASANNQLLSPEVLLP
jgi:tRNA pseudouridine55 synthase